MSRKKQKPESPIRPEVGRPYRITNYHTGDFVGTCVAKEFSFARYRVNAPLDSLLRPGEEIDISFSSPARIVFQMREGI